MKPSFTTVEWAGPKEAVGEEIYIPSYICRKSGLEQGSQYKLTIGSFQIQVVLKNIEDINNKIWCSETIYKQLDIPTGSILNLVCDEDKNLNMGPLIGLLAVKFDESENPFGRQAKVLSALCERASKAKCFVYAFSPNDVNWETKTINGYIPEKLYLSSQTNNGTETGKNTLANESLSENEEPIRWVQLRLPFPNLVYNRIPSRYWENQENFSMLLDILQQYFSIPLFNPGFLDKWEVYEKLAPHPEASFYLPKTTLVYEPTDISSFMDHHKEGYLKPTAGSLGRRIIRLFRNNNNFLYIYRNSKGEIVEGAIGSATELLQTLRMVMGKRQYIIQEAIPLAQYEGHDFDVRLLMQKDRYGSWRRTKTYVRITQPGSMTTNLSSGASAESIVEVIRKVFNEEFTEPGGIGERIKTAAQIIASAIETVFPDNWAELGIDLGIDINGGIWLIEVNSKPFRALSSSTGLNQRIERSFLRPLEYARLLTGFYPHSIY